MSTIYGQFCPIAKATEVVGERWTILIIRELLCGSTRFNQLQRGLSQISPTLLTKRLNQLIDHEIVFKKSVSGQKHSEYFLTPAGLELGPLIMGLGDWGMKWTRSQMEEEELDVEFLMLAFYRRVDLDQVPGRRCVIHFSFTGLKTFPHWWMVLDETNRDLCVAPPGLDVEITVKTDLGTMARIWDHQLSMTQAKREQRLQLEGLPIYTRSISKWLRGNPLTSSS